MKPKIILHINKFLIFLNYIIYFLLWGIHRLWDVPYVWLDWTKRRRKRYKTGKNEINKISKSQFLLCSPRQQQFKKNRLHIFLLGNVHLTWRGGYGFFLKKYSDSQCCWKKYSDFGGGKKENLIQSFCHIT